MIFFDTMKRSNPRYKIKMKDIPVHERPRERIINSGVSSLNNSELLSAIIGFGSGDEGVTELSNRILSKYSLERLARASVGELNEIFGISDAKACRIVAAMELGRRAATPKFGKRMTLDNSSDVAGIVVPEMRNLNKEILRGIYLDSKKHIIKNEVISVGGLNTNNTHPRDIFGPAVRESAAAVIVVHNHPSGDPTPSKGDIDATKKIVRVGKILGIDLLDHLIIGKNGYVSLREEGFL
ncbi:MAG: DNA repair protein RadC [Candidatus Aenigmarchaeota archaeon]|nr:DNA repair protein RadC [Candidatus Aenigmarchaeota archaeon]